MFATATRSGIPEAHEHDPHTDQRIIHGVDRTLGTEYGLGATDLAEYILERFDHLEDAKAGYEGIKEALYDVITSARFARTSMFEERFLVHPGHWRKAQKA